MERYEDVIREFTVNNFDGVLKQGFIEVSQEEFWELVLSERRSIHPKPEKYITIWRFTKGDKNVWGLSTPGYLCIGAKRYALSQ